MRKSVGESSPDNGSQEEFNQSVSHSHQSSLSSSGNFLVREKRKGLVFVITIMGTGGNGTYGNHGALLAGNAMITSVDGDIAITGTGGTGTTVNNLGVYVVGAHVSSTGIVACPHPNVCTHRPASMLLAITSAAS